MKRVLSPSVARRLFLSKQRLAGSTPPATRAGILGLVQELGCLQLDPISAVTRTHRIVLFSRLGAYPEVEFEHLRWKDRTLFEYWAHAASIVPTADWPLHQPMMKNYAKRNTAWMRELLGWMKENADLEKHVFEELHARGPLPSRHFEDRTKRNWNSTGWNAGRNVGRMLDFLWLQGRILVAGREGQQKLWDLTERVLPPDTSREELAPKEIVRRAVLRSLAALGVAKKRQIEQHFLRNRYPGIQAVLNELLQKKQIQEVSIAGEGLEWPGPWYMLAEDSLVVDRLEAGDWQPRTTLLSPFDNLICDRARTQQFFDFDFRIEIYVPAAKRQYGYYVLPVLQGDMLIGRIDPLMDRKSAELKINAVHAEANAPKNKATAQAVAKAIEELAAWLGAKQITYGDKRPPGWKRWLT